MFIYLLKIIFIYYLFIYLQLYLLQMRAKWEGISKKIVEFVANA